MATVRLETENNLAGEVAQAAAGDEVAFARVVQAHHDDMTRVCFVICGDLDIADEAVQAAWPIAWRKLGSLRDRIGCARGSYRSPRTRRASSSAGGGAGRSSSLPWPTPARRASIQLDGTPTSISPTRSRASMRKTGPSWPFGTWRASTRQSLPGRSGALRRGRAPGSPASSPASERSSAMTDRLEFEAHLAERLRARADIASRPFDAAAVAHQAALAGGRRRFGRSLWLADRPALRWALLCLPPLSDRRGDRRWRSPRPGSHRVDRLSVRERHPRRRRSEP